MKKEPKIKDLPVEKANLSMEEEVELMSSCGFTNSEMASYLKLSKNQFLSQALSEGTKIYEAILRGRLKTEISITQKQKDLAEAGNITAVQIFEKRLFQKKLQQFKEQIYLGI